MSDLAPPGVTNKQPAAMKIEARCIEDVVAGEIPFIADEPRQYPEIKELFASAPPMGAVCIACVEPKWPRNFPAMCECVTQEAWEHFLAKLDGYAVWFFIAHGPWQPRSRLVGYYRLWKGLQKHHGFHAPSGSPEIEVTSAEGVRYAGLCRLTASTFEPATKLLRAWPSSAIFLAQHSQHATEEMLREMFSTAFPLQRGLPAKRVEWPRLVAHYCPEGRVVVKSGGHVDERKCTLEFIGRRREVDAFVNVIPSEWFQD